MKRKKRQENFQVTKWLLPIAVVLFAGIGLWLLLGGKKDEPTSEESRQICAPIEPVGDSIKVTASIYLDVSGSMAGYASQQSNTYYDVLAELMSFYPQTDGKIINCDTIIPGEDLINNLLKGRITYSGESLLDQDLEYLANDAEKFAISETEKSKKKTPVHLNFFVTDGIMSFSSDEIKANPECNRIHARDLQNRITKVFNGKKHIGVSLYQFSSLFSGTYFCYDNAKIPLSGTNRYFYVIAIGDRAVLADLKAKIAKRRAQVKGLVLTPEKEWHAIDILPLNSNLVIDPVNVSSNSNVYEYEPKHINKSKDGLLSFSLPLEKVLRNHFVENWQALTDSVVINIDNKEYKMKDAANKVRYNYKFNLKTKLLGFCIKVSELGPQSELIITIPNLIPVWIDNSRAPIDEKNGLQDDHDKLKLGEKTFLFDYFMHGIRNGVDGDNKPLYECRVKLIQKK